MVALAIKPRPEARDGEVLAEAVRRIAGYWDLTNEGLGEILGLSSSTVSRLRSGAWRFQEGTKSFELAQYLTRLFRSLDSIVGNGEAARTWLGSDNLGLNGVPRDLLLTPQGLVHVVDYLDAHRARG